MKIAVMQPYLFPYLGYFQMMCAVDHFVALDDVNFIKGGWINRNRVAARGRELMFSLPLSGASPNKKINEIAASDHPTWHRKFQQTLAQMYAEAPYVEKVSKLVAKTLSTKHANIAHKACDSWTSAFAYLKISGPSLSYSSELGRQELKGQDGVINICKRLGGTHYINAIGGQSLYDKGTFLQEGITLSFIKADLQPYSQGYEPFNPGLSMIDVLMWNSPEKVREMLTQYTLV